MAAPILPTKIRKYRERNFYLGGYLLHSALILDGSYFLWDAAKNWRSYQDLSMLISSFVFPILFLSLGSYGFVKNLRLSHLHHYLRLRGKPAMAKLRFFKVKRTNSNFRLIPHFFISKVHCVLDFLDDEGNQRILELKTMPGHVLETIQDLTYRQIPEIYVPILFDPKNPARGVVDWIRWQRS